jgi:hypothetical protein
MPVRVAKQSLPVLGQYLPKAADRSADGLGAVRRYLIRRLRKVGY